MNENKIVGHSKSGNPFSLDEQGNRIYHLTCTFCENVFLTPNPKLRFCNDICRQNRDAESAKRMREMSKSISKKQALKRGKRKKPKKKLKEEEYVELNIPQKILKIKELKYEDSSSKCITIEIAKSDIEYIDSINLVATFFRQYGRVPNKKDRFKKEGRGHRAYFYDLFSDVRQVVRSMWNYVELGEDIVYICEQCSKMYSEYHGHYEEYCSKDCYDKSEKGNTCEICGRKFHGSSGYDSMCRDCKKIEAVSVNPISSLERDSGSYEEALKELVKQRVEEIITKAKETQPHCYNDILIDYNNVGGFSESVKQSIRSRDNFQCQVCGATTNLHVHHILARRKGGNHEDDNLITLCASCHMSIETGLVEHATRKCTRNALKNGGILKPKDSQVDDPTKIKVLIASLERIFDMVNDDYEPCEVLCYIDNTLENI